MQNDAMLTQLGYSPNKALVEQLQRIQQNTKGYDKIQKHIMDLHNALKVDGSYVAMSNTNDLFKIKVEPRSPDIITQVHEKIQHFSTKYKVEVDKLPNKETYYIVGFNHQ